MDWNAFIVVVANIATAITFPVAVAAAVIGIRTYKVQARAADDAHMHGLFREYLSVGASGGATVDNNRLEVLKLYAFEEMLAWVHRQQRALNAWPRIWRREERERRQESISTWTATIRSHLKTDKLAVKWVLKYRHCYDSAFVALIEDIEAERQKESRPKE